MCSCAKVMLKTEAITRRKHDVEQRVFAFYSSRFHSTAGGEVGTRQATKTTPLGGVIAVS